MDSFQCTGTFKVKTGKVSAPPKEFAAAKGQQSNGQAATGGAAHPQRPVHPTTCHALYPFLLLLLHTASAPQCGKLRTLA